MIFLNCREHIHAFFSKSYITTVILLSRCRGFHHSLYEENDPNISELRWSISLLELSQKKTLKIRTNFSTLVFVHAICMEGRIIFCRLTGKKVLSNWNVCQIYL